MNFSLLTHYLVQEKHKVNTVAPSWTQRHRNTQNRPAHTSNIFCLPQFTTCVINHTPPHLVIQLSLWFQITFLPALHKNSPSTALPTSTSTSKLKVFFKGNCHNDCNIHILCVCVSVFLNHLACVKLCYPFFINFLSFFDVSLTKFYISCP